MGKIYIGLFLPPSPFLFHCTASKSDLQKEKVRLHYEREDLDPTHYLSKGQPLQEGRPQIQALFLRRRMRTAVGYDVARCHLVFVVVKEQGAPTHVASWKQLQQRWALTQGSPNKHVDHCQSHLAS